MQLFWFLIVLYGKDINPLIQLVTAILIVGIDYYIVRPKISIGRYLFLIGLFTFIGFVNDSSLIWLKLIYKNSYHYGNLSLWIIFLAYYDQIFIKFKNLSLGWLAFIGGVGGAVTYLSAANLGAVMIVPEMEKEYFCSQFIFWAAFFPLSLKIYFTSDYWEKLLDKTIVFSFDKSGFSRHQKSFSESLEGNNILGKNALVTGATAGIGASIASSLSRLGGKVYVTGRNQEKGLAFEKQYSHAKFVSLDMANWKEVYEFAKTSDSLDYVVFNAGSMPDKLSANEFGVEFQCSSQLLGHYYLLIWLKKFEKLKPNSRIVWVSSGGMYLKKLDLESLFNNTDYDKVDTYANVKRAQVTLVEELAKKDEWDNFYIYSMHPGWVGTDGLKGALPGFYRFMQNRLRSVEEGADTILWCLLATQPPVSGGFYFDRKKVSPYISQKYFPSTEERAKLLSKLESYRDAAEKSF